MPVALPPPQGNGSRCCGVRSAWRDARHPLRGGFATGREFEKGPPTPCSRSVSSEVSDRSCRIGSALMSEHPVNPHTAVEDSMKDDSEEPSDMRRRTVWSTSSVNSSRRVHSRTSLETPRSDPIPTHKRCRALRKMAAVAAFSCVGSESPRAHFRSATTATPAENALSIRVDTPAASSRPREPGRIPDRTRIDALWAAGVVVRGTQRIRAAALRLEGYDHRWRATSFTIL